MFFEVNIWCVLQLLESRSRVIKTDAERELWQTATLELMSDEEDAIVDERPVWVVRSPPHRNQQLSDLCFSADWRRICAMPLHTVSVLELMELSQKDTLFCYFNKHCLCVLMLLLI